MPTSDQLLAELKLLHPKLIDLSLGRIERLLERLGDPHHRLPPVIHIAGTNGKGSTSAFLKEILVAAGLRVHAYTSPHLIRFHERIALANEDGETHPIGDNALIDILTRTQAANSGNDITQFEITTAAALLAFSETPADVLILEVGLGGRLDATNVIAKPALTVITPVSLDHCDKLGSTLAKIASEKAGILKPGVTAIVAQQEEEARETIINQAERIGAPTRAWGQDFTAHEQHGRLVYQGPEALFDLPLPSLMGPHQLINAGTAIATVLALDDDRIDEKTLQTGLTQVHWPARLQRLCDGPLPSLLSATGELWLDGGHNPAAGVVLAQALADLEDRSPKPLHLIVGMMSLKDAEGFLSPFRGLAAEVIAVPVPGSLETPLEPKALAVAAEHAGLASHTAASVESALRQVELRRPGAKRVLICGSLYLAGHVLALQEGVEPQAN